MCCRCRSSSSKWMRLSFVLCFACVALFQLLKKRVEKEYETAGRWITKMRWIHLHNKWKVVDGNRQLHCCLELLQCANGLSSFLLTLFSRCYYLAISCQCGINVETRMFLHGVNCRLTIGQLHFDCPSSCSMWMASAP